jgi:CRISPR/Cas system-associated exonuclease Cas4 (RecB family)
MASVTNLCEHALQHCDDSDMVGVSMRNEVNMRGKAIGISFRRKDQLSTDVILNVWQVTQSNSHFNALYKLVLEVHSVKMPVGFGCDD